MNARDSSAKLNVAVVLAYTMEAMVSSASNFLTIGIFFFMRQRFGWELKHNFYLSASLGVVYTCGALAADWLARKLGKRRPLVGAYLFMSAGLLVATISPTQFFAIVAVLGYAVSSATTWPIIESIVTGGNLDSHLIARRATLYNVIWAAVAVIVIACNGIVLERFPIGVFLIPLIVCLIAAVIALFGPILPVESNEAEISHAAPEPQLARQRVLALWLARISVPAMYIVIYALAAMLPLLPVIVHHRPAMQTLLSSVWLLARWIAFVGLGATVFWHTRPRLLLVAAATLLISFIVITIPASEWIGEQNDRADLILMIAGQIAFGLATGLIYMSSLYFGMVLSDGSTEHGGYHEALIGLGMTLGPAVGAMTQKIWPADQRAAVAAVSGLIGISILLASFASLRFSRSRVK